MNDSDVLIFFIVYLRIGHPTASNEVINLQVPASSRPASLNTTGNEASALAHFGPLLHGELAN